ncbi:YkgJ family cysteine cluster protein [uncultured Dialister sp.]|uniref:YkgJ family cysteine cluster protein n=1 Tax=uncultured Dialister sp. TaxID=278064 RepID=UPI002615912A|nr:YkgJ family cysteine cluster protein [uncultured Dialister sp.]
MMHFPCIACGLCCEKARYVEELQNFLDKKGQCCFYDRETKKCRIYHRRPAICCTKTMYEKKFRASMSEKDYVLANLSVCRELNLAAGNKENAERIRRIMEEIRESAGNEEAL